MRCGSLLVLLLSSGCAYLRPADASLRAPVSLTTGGDCLVVLMPGLGDDHEDFVRHGFVAELQRDGSCDVEVLDAHFGYYREGNIASRLAGRLESVRDQYREIWLVGVSLGAYGAALTARERPELVDGIVLISPFLGVPRAVRPVVSEIQRVGGLQHYATVKRAPSRPKRHFMEVEPLWGWFAQKVRGAEGPEIHVAYGTADEFAWSQEVLASSPGLGSATRQPGGHDWATFSSLFTEFMRRGPPWKG